MCKSDFFFGDNNVYLHPVVELQLNWMKKTAAPKWLTREVGLFW